MNVVDVVNIDVYVGFVYKNFLKFVLFFLSLLLILFVFVVDGEEVMDDCC